MSHYWPLLAEGQLTRERFGPALRGCEGWRRYPCRTEEALVAVEQAVLERLPEGSREANLR